MITVSHNLRSSLLQALILVIAIALTACTSGETLIVTQKNIENVIYRLNDDNDTASAIRYQATGEATPPELIIQGIVKANDKTYKVTSIGPKAFIDLDITSIMLGENLLTIEKEAFKYCTGITEIDFSGEVLPTLSVDAFETSVYETATLIVPKGTELPFPWSNFKNVTYSSILRL